MKFDFNLVISISEFVVLMKKNFVLRCSSFRSSLKLKIPFAEQNFLILKHWVEIRKLEISHKDRQRKMIPWQENPFQMQET